VTTSTAAAGNRPALPLADACCAPLLREPITASQAADLARLLKAPPDPTRLRLVSAALSALSAALQPVAAQPG
jgi:ArsR family transcriptional regulator